MATLKIYFKQLLIFTTVFTFLIDIIVELIVKYFNI